MFNESHDFAINGGTFNSAGRDILNVSFEEGERGLLTLHRYTSTSASFNAEARYPPPLCHPRTRKAILEDLHTWVNAAGGSDDGRVRWIYGPAGAGKSAIAQTFAEKCTNDGTLAGSFFFWRSDASRNNPQRLFTTIALQMALAIPQLRGAINSAVMKDPSALTASLETQFDALILQPWLQALSDSTDEGGIAEDAYQVVARNANKKMGSYPRRVTEPPRKRLKGSEHSSVSEVKPLKSSWILVIDGLDECSNSQNQQRVLSIVSSIMQKHTLPLRILICSRPEPRIKELFSKTDFKNICQWMPLESTYEVSQDIQVFLEDRFRRILERHSCSMEHVSRPWPTVAQIEQLVQKASGQFIYPSTVLKYVDDDGAVPADRLKIILGLPAESYGTDSPFAELDALYHQILSTVKNPDTLLQILGARIVFQDRSQHGWHYRFKFTDLLPLPLGILNATFSGVHSLFRNPSPVESNLEYCHASFRDFLLDQKRSLQFFVDKASGHDYLAQCCLDILIAYLKCDSRRPADPLVDYAEENWAYHCVNASGSNDLLSRLELLDVYSAITCRTQTVWWIFGQLRKLARTLAKIVQVWLRFQDKRKQHLQSFRDVCTRGFTLICKSRQGSIKEYMISIPMSRDVYSGAKGVDPNLLEAHLKSEVKSHLRLDASNRLRSGQLIMVTLKFAKYVRSY